MTKVDSLLDFDGTEDAVETIIKAIETAGYVPGKDVFLGFDCASSEFYDKERKVYDYTKFEGEGAAERTAAEQIDYLEELVNKYPIITIEDAYGRKRLGRMERTY